MIKKFLEFSELFEAKQSGLLYHYTSLDSLIAILDSNILKGTKPNNPNDAKLGDKYYICFTRNKNFHLQANPSVYVECRLTFDGDKLSNNYQITPYECNLIYYGDEFEERIYLNKGKLHIKDITKYLLSIDIYAENLSNSKKAESTLIDVKKIINSKRLNVEVNIDNFDMESYIDKHIGGVNSISKNIVYQRGGHFKVIKDNFSKFVDEAMQAMFVTTKRFNINFTIGSFTESYIEMIFENTKIKLICVWDLDENKIKIKNQINKKGTFDVAKFIEELSEDIE